MSNLQWVKFQNQGREGWANYSGPSVTWNVEKSFWNSVGKVCTATESRGGVVSALNCYDQAIISLGMLQYAGAIPGSPLMKLFGAFNATDKDLLLKLLQPAFDATTGSGYNGSYFTLNGKNVVSTQDWCDLIQKGVSGKFGSWTDEAKNTSKAWATTFINVAEQHVFIESQKKFFEDSLQSTYFQYCVFPVTDPDLNKKVKVEPVKIFDYNKETIEKEDPYKRACIAAFISYAANIPLYALQNLYFKVSKNESLSWKEKFNDFCKACSTSSIKEWPGRWLKIAPVLKQEFGVDVSLMEDTPKLDVNVTSVTEPVDTITPIVIEDTTNVDIPVHEVTEEDNKETKLVIPDSKDNPKNLLDLFFQLIKWILNIINKKP